MTLIAIFMLFNLQAQDADTTQIRIGKSKIIIIKEGVDRLEKGRQEFVIQIDSLKENLVVLQEELKNNRDELTRKKLKLELENLEKTLEAYENGIENIDEELENFSENNDDFDFDNDDNDDNLPHFSPDEWNDYDWRSHWKSRKSKFRGHWSGLDLGFNMLLGENFSDELPEGSDFLQLNVGRSMSFSLNFLQISLPIYKKQVGFVVGMGLKWNSYELKNDYTLRKADNGAISGEVSGLDYEKNKLSTLNLTLPLLFEMQFPANKKFHLTAGVVGSLRLTSHYMREYSIGEENFMVSQRDNFSLSQLSYGLTVRFGYSFLNFYANYSLVPLFEKDKAPAVYPLTVGLTLLRF